MNNRNGYLSIELLLVIGVLVGGIASAFIGLKNINNNLDNFNLIQDLKNLSSSLESFNNNFGAYPEQSTESIISNTNWNQYGSHSSIVKRNLAEQWVYKTTSLTSKDNNKLSTGVIEIKINGNYYNELKNNVIIDTLSKFCLNSLSNIVISEAITTNKISSKSSWCILKQNVKIIDLN